MSEPFIVDLSLSRELQREQDRRAAVRLNHQDLQILTDKLICDWYANQTVIDSAFRHIAELQVQLALATAKPLRQEPEPRHFQWARDLLGKRD